ncbi:gliding motility-associated peptidyl-prolyl isomerase GldI [Croceiramulus getboli]|nr:gliding motility-associated peptidyl-prolyl isomerase GldI [Flavobacteriaceae bacterium YJPT1-3]
MKKLIYLLAVGSTLLACKTPEARRPVSQSTSTSFSQATIERNRALNAADEIAIKDVIAARPDVNFIASENGFWYYYNVKDTLSTTTPETGDLVSFNYDLKKLDGTVLVSQEELGTETYQIEQSNQELISGLRDGLKLMKAGETVTFLLPSHKAYGYYGLDNKIGSNVPLMSTVTLNTIEPKTTEN